MRKIVRGKSNNINGNNGNTGINGNKPVLRPLIIKKIETPSIVIETPSKPKKSYNFNNFKRLSYLNTEDEDDDEMFNYDSLSGNNYGSLNSLNAYELNPSKFDDNKFGESKFDLNNYALGKLNGKVTDYPLNNYKTFSHFSKPNFESIDSLNNHLSNYASSNYMNNRNLYLKRNKIDPNDQQPDDNQFNESNPKKVSSLLHTISSMPEYYASLSTHRPYLASTIAYNENSTPFSFQHPHNNHKKIIVEDKLIDEKQDNENNQRNEQQENYEKNEQDNISKEGESYQRANESKKDEQFQKHNFKLNADNLVKNNNSTSKLIYALTPVSITFYSLKIINR